MKIYSPVDKPLIRQGFGEAQTSPLVMPIYQAMGMKGHDGLDFGVQCKNYDVEHGGQCQQVYYNMDGYGTITYIQKDDTSGWGINALDQDGIHKYCFWHFDVINPDLKVGDRIESGDLLGTSGRTGKATGPHVHFGLYSFDEPEDNGYRGAIDPSPYYIPIFINTVISNLEGQIGILQQLINLIRKALNL